uniref:chromate efflux transporter n=1 Tax=Algihabitans albus TaxID=2164067 RepID=UPI0038B36C00
MTEERAKRGRAGEVFTAFAKLGVTAFGGPVAHLGYFRTEFVQRRRWLDDRTYGEYVALAQFLPGPASSQVGMALGAHRAGWLGGLAAWTAFTLPSALLMIAFAYGVVALGDVSGAGWLTGLKLVAVAVVVQALWQMANSLCPDRPRAGLALGGAALALLAPVFFGSAVWGQVGAILLGGMIGAVAFRRDASNADYGGLAVGRGFGALLLGSFFVLLVLLPPLASADGTLAVFDSFYRAGALVFGGGHVVLPLLQAETVPTGWVEPDLFLAGYGAAQALPGPLFTFAAYLGAAKEGAPSGLLGGAIALIAVFLPGALLIFGVLPFWQTLRRKPAMAGAVTGANAAVVGILLAALYDPLWTGTVTAVENFVFLLAALALLMLVKVPPWAVVAAGALAGWALL